MPQSLRPRQPAHPSPHPSPHQSLCGLRRRAGKIALALVAGCLIAGNALAGSLHDALERAVSRAVGTRVAEARRDEAAAGQLAAGAWFARPPSIGLAERNDRQYRGQGERERELELALPLWLPGQRAARQLLAERESADSDAALNAARLLLAGELREAIWAWQAARSELELAGERQQTAAGLAADIARREAAGDLARTDLLLAREDALAADAAVADAQLRERQAAERFRLLTGLATLPEVIEETLPPDTRQPLPLDIAADEAPPALAAHPRLLLAATGTRRAEAELALARANRRDAPELSLGWREARDTSQGPESQTLRFALRLPLSTEARNAPLIAAANTGRIRAETEWRQTLADVSSQVGTAQSALELAEAAARAARQRAELASERQALLERAFTLGELSLGEFMRVRSAASQARLDARRADNQLGSARARLNQAWGLLP